MLKGLFVLPASFATLLPIDFCCTYYWLASNILKQGWVHVRKICCFTQSLFQHRSLNIVSLPGSCSSERKQLAVVWNEEELETSCLLLSAQGTIRPFRAPLTLLSADLLKAWCPLFGREEYSNLQTPGSLLPAAQSRSGRRRARRGGWITAREKPAGRAIAPYLGASSRANSN